VWVRIRPEVEGSVTTELRKNFGKTENPSKRRE
jgi:hypothetical protein